MKDCIIPQILLDFEDLSGHAESKDPYLLTDVYTNLRDIAKKRAPRTILEIGTRYGYSLAVMMDGCKGNTVEHVVSIDTTEKLPDHYGGDHRIYPQTIRRLKALHEDGRYWPHVKEMHFIDANTQKLRLLKLPEGVGSIDLAYIDGDHSPKGAIHDLELVLPHMSPNGWMIGDDADHHPGLKQRYIDWAVDMGYSYEHVPDRSNRGRVIICVTEED